MIEIHCARYGIGQAQDVDISSFLKHHDYFLTKNMDLTSVFGDPYPNQPKHIHVQFTIHHHQQTILLENDDDGNLHFHLPPSSCSHRIGYVTDTYLPYNIHLPGLYKYRVSASTFDIDDVSIVSSEQRVRSLIDDDAVIQSLLHRTEDGFVQFRSSTTVLNIPDPFPDEPTKHLRLTYSRSTTYDVTVHEFGGHLFKDVKLSVELPYYRTVMMYHLFPRFNHPLMDIHWMYLRRALPMFERVVISVADESSSQETANEQVIRSKLGDPSNVTFLHIQNVAQRGEATSFLRLVEHVKNALPGVEYAFYAHSKGLTHYDVMKLRNVACWTELMYNGCLANLDLLIHQNATFGGNFKRSGTINRDANPRWHYTGSYYWFRTDVFTTHSTSRPLTSYAFDYYISERFPGLMVPSTKGCLVFLSFPPHSSANLYTTRAVQAFATEVKSYCHSQLAHLAVV